MRKLILTLTIALTISHWSLASEPVSCSEKTLSENALTEKMTSLKNNLKDKNLSTSDRKQMVKKTLDEMNCQIDLTANDPRMADSPSRWKSIQYQDLLKQALETDCQSDKQSIPKKTKTEASENFLNAYCTKKQN